MAVVSKASQPPPVSGGTPRQNTFSPYSEKSGGGNKKDNQKEFWRGVVPALLEQAAGLAEAALV